MTKEELLQRFDILSTEYIKILNDKDVLLNWGKPQLEALYVTMIGKYQIEQLQLELRIKALKRKIEMIRSAVARNEIVDIAAIVEKVEEELAEAEIAIMKQVIEVEKGTQLLSHLDTPERSSELRKIFREMAKLLHPDVNDNFTDEQQHIWHQIKNAYDVGDLEKLKAFQIIYEKDLTNISNLTKELSIEQLELKNLTLSEGIKLLQAEIDAIKSQYPFTIEQQIKDEEWVKQQQEALINNINTLKNYTQELNIEFETLELVYGGTTKQ